jgi:hypothetical protein
LLVEVVGKLQFFVLVIRRAAKLVDCFKVTDIEIFWNTFERKVNNPITFLQKISKLQITNISYTLDRGEIKYNKIKYIRPITESLHPISNKIIC